MNIVHVNKRQWGALKLLTEPSNRGVEVTIEQPGENERQDGLIVTIKLGRRKERQYHVSPVGKIEKFEDDLDTPDDINDSQV